MIRSFGKNNNRGSVSNYIAKQLKSMGIIFVPKIVSILYIVFYKLMEKLPSISEDQ